MNNHSSKLKTQSKRGSPAPLVGRDSGKRDRILEAAVKVFAREGFYNAKVSQIADAAGVADGTIYLYFKSKDDLLISLFEDRMERINARMRDAITSETTAIGKLERLVHTHLDFVQSNRPMAEVFTVELRQSAKFIKEYANPKFGDFLRIFAGVIAEGQASGELANDLDPPLVARALFGAVDEIALAYLVGGTRKPHNDLAQAAKQISKLFIEGLRTDRRRTP